MTPKPLPSRFVLHPIEDPDIVERVKRQTKALLVETGGTGKVTVSYHFHNYKPTGDDVEVSAKVPKSRP